MICKFLKHAVLLCLLLAVVMYAGVAEASSVNQNSGIKTEAVWNDFDFTTTGVYKLDTSGDVPELALEKDATVSITPDFVYDSEQGLTYYWGFYNWNTDEGYELACKTKTYTFTFEAPGNLSFYASDNGTNVVDQNIYLVEYQKPDTYEEHSNCAVNDVLSIWFWAENIGDADIREYVTDNFIRDWNGDGVIGFDELNQNVTVKWESDFKLLEPLSTKFMELDGYYVEPGELVAQLGSFKKTDDGKQVKLTLENVNGEVFTATYTYHYNCAEANP